MANVLLELEHKNRISPAIVSITSVYGRWPNVIKSAFLSACFVVHTKCEMTGNTYKNTDNPTAHTIQSRTRTTANSMVFCELII